MFAEEIEKRLTALEAEVERLRNKVEPGEKTGWKKLVGAFLNDPLFEQAMKAGREYRESLRPKPKVRRRKKADGDS